MADELGRWASCICQRERRILHELPPRYHAAKVSDFPAVVQQRTMEWLSDPRDGLLITGPVGAGKTHLAAAITRLLLEKEKSGVFCRAADFYRDLRDTYTNRPGKRDDESEHEVFERLTEPRFLVFDDLGAGSGSDHERRATLEVLDQRLNHLRPTVVTTNWSLAEIAERMDDRIASRLAGFTVLRLAGPDRRVAGRVVQGEQIRIPVGGGKGGAVLSRH